MEVNIENKTTPDWDSNLKKAYIEAGIGNIEPVLQFFDSIPDIEHSKYFNLFQRYQDRFVHQDEPFHLNEPFINQLFILYSEYWRKNLVPNKDGDNGEKRLLSELKKLLEIEAKNTAYGDLEEDQIFELLDQIAESKGYHLLLGRTPPLLDLMIWTQEDEEIYKIELPDETLDVKVQFLSNFLCKGWYGFATFDEKHTAGWATDEAIYCVGKKTIHESEWFRVSFLGHEGRHISDKNKYNLSNATELEYRAKLTELILADKTFLKLLKKFKDQAKDDPSSPHASASYRVMSELETIFPNICNLSTDDKISCEKIQKVKLEATRLLSENTRKLMQVSEN